jgi:tight adherence protein B
MDSETLIYLILGLVVCGGIYFGVIDPILSGEARADQRKKALQATTRRSVDRNVDANARRKQVAESLKELEARGKQKKLTIEKKIKQAGLKITKQQFFIYSAISGAIFAGLLLLVTEELLYAIPGFLIGAFGVPNWIVSFIRKRRINKFVLLFPDAVDVIVRGVKAGLPLGDCMRIIASEAPEPVRSEFRSVVEAQTMGLSASEAIERISENIPTAEANFFTIVIAIQQKAGGNLSEALSGLSKVLRDRMRMKHKIKAMSSEAKASAGIIGSLPFAVTLLVYLSSPRYIELLWITSTGRVVLAVSAFVMFIGCMVMRKMISFDF